MAPGHGLWKQRLSSLMSAACLSCQLVAGTRRVAAGLKVVVNLLRSIAEETKRPQMRAPLM